MRPNKSNENYSSTYPDFLVVDIVILFIIKWPKTGQLWASKGALDAITKADYARDKRYSELTNV